MNYLQWLSQDTETVWWDHSAAPGELEQGLAWGAKGVTTNPVLVHAAVQGDRSRWAGRLAELPGDAKPQTRAIRLTGMLVQAARATAPAHLRGVPRKAWPGVWAARSPFPHECRRMQLMADEFRAWAPNVSVKHPATAAGLEALEETLF